MWSQQDLSSLTMTWSVPGEVLVTPMVLRSTSSRETVCSQSRFPVPFQSVRVDWPDWTVIFGLDQTGPKNFGPVLDFWDRTVKWSPLFDGTGPYMVRP